MAAFTEMSGTTTYAFTDAQKVDIRRFCGYPTFGNASSGFQGYRFFQAYGLLEFRLNNSSTAEGTVIVNTYLANLALLEQNLIAVGTTGALDTEAAGPWTRNPAEVRERTRLFDDTRRRLCGFLGLPPGPDLGASGNTASLIA